MNNIRLNIDNLAAQLLPWFKRQTARVTWLRALLSPLKDLSANFEAYKRDTRVLVNVTGQVKVLEGFLREKYGQVSIIIETFDDMCLDVGLLEEGATHLVNIPLEAEGTGPAVPLYGERKEAFGDVDFIVYIPAGVDADAVRADIARFKIAIVKFKIVQK